MLYPWLDWQRQGVEALLSLTRLTSGMSPLDAALLQPTRELLARTLAAGAARERPVEAVVVADAPFAVRAEIAATPFVRLVRLRGPAESGRGFVVLAPHSGYAAAVISPLITSLLTLGEVLVTDWVDGRMVPAAAGGFGLPEQIAVCLEAAGDLEGQAHLVAVSQSGPATLAAAALLASHSSGRAPASLVFLGCQLDPRVSPTPLQQMLAGWPRELLHAGLTAKVAADYPGRGRRVYPSVLQLLAYGMASPGLYADVQRGLLHELAFGRAGEFDRQHADIHSLLDVPSELFMHMLAWTLDRAPWRRGMPVLAGTGYDLSPLRHAPVLTLEAGLDELVGAGQTHGLGKRLAGTRGLTLPAARHHDLFTGHGFVTLVAPLLRQFYLEIGR